MVVHLAIGANWPKLSALQMDYAEFSARHLWMLKEFRASVGSASATERPAARRPADVLPLFQQKLAGCPKLDLISFDVYDTVMTRSVGEPSSLFYLLGEQLLERGILRGSPEGFARSLQSASHRARSAIAPPGDVTLAGIYEELVHGLPYLREHVEVMMAAELDLERKLSRPMPGAHAMIELARANSRAIAFVSDMYLPEEFIRGLLVSHGLARPEDAVYVSNTRGRMKARGGALFDYVLAQHSVQPGRALHIGDKVEWDFAPARARGMHALLLPYGLLNRYETALEARRCDSRGLTSVLAGASRLARLHGLERGGREVITDVLAGVAGPLLCGFTTWLIDRAQTAGIRRLYFLAREGQLLYELAGVLNERLNLGLDLRYLYVSRQSLNLALLTDPSETNLAFSLTSTSSYSLRAVLERVGLEPGDIEGEVHEIGLPKSAWDRKLSSAEHDSLVKLLQHGRPRQLLIERAIEARELAEQYLESEGLFEDIPIGLVDTTGVGSQLRTLNLLRSARSSASTEGFLAVRNWGTGLQHAGFPTIHGYLADHYSKRGFRTLPGVVQMLEVFSRADHGMVLGYRRSGGAVEPVLRAGQVDWGEEWDIPRMRSVIKVFMEEFVAGANMLAVGRDARSGSLSAFRAFWEDPTPEEAEFWGGFQYERGSSSGHGVTDLAPRWGVSDVLARALGKRLAHEQWFTWRDAGERRSAWQVRALLQLARLTKRAVGKARDLIGNGARRTTRA
jgi:FMN phosphatase YigB (HAD superfamily)